MTKQEILRNELEVFFDDWGFSVYLLEESTDEYPLFQIGPLETASFLNDDGKFFLALVNKVEDKFHPYREEIIFYYDEANEAGKKLIPLEIRIHKYPETQHVYVHDIPEKNTRAEVKADDRFPPVMAASILAKTARDLMMERYGRLYPEYEYPKIPLRNNMKLRRTHEYSRQESIEVRP